MTSSKRAAVLCTLLLIALPGAAHAQRTASDLESARQLYNQGIELRDKGDMKGALEKFRAAHALGNTPLTGIELCKAHATLAQPVEAREVCLGVARIPPMGQETQRSQDARTEAGKIAEDQRPKIGALRLKIKGVPEKREPTVTVDGINVPAAALNETRAVNPGIHVITARVGTGAETRATLETREGESRELELVVQPPPANEPPPPPPGGQGPQPVEPKKKSNTFATVAFGTAAVAGTIGLLFGIDALAKKGKLTDRCPNNLCPPSQHERLEDAESSGNAATAFFVIGGVALGVGLIATLASGRSSAAVTPPNNKPNVTPVFGLGGAGLHGTF